MDYSSYISLKKKRAEEQGKTWWFEAILTDEEANLRVSRGPPEEHSCNYCKFLKGPARRCSLEHTVTDVLSQVCDEWRYIA